MKEAYRNTMYSVTDRVPQLPYTFLLQGYKCASTGLNSRDNIAAAVSSDSAAIDTHSVEIIAKKKK